MADVFGRTASRGRGRLSGSRLARRSSMRSNNERSILIVEDNPDDLELTIEALEENGVRNPIIVAKDGAEALRQLFDESTELLELPVIILLDLNLPKVGGIDVLRRIREHERTRMLPVIILTSSTEERDL